MSASDDLDAPYPLTAGQVAHYRDRGYVRLRDVLAPETLAHFRDAVTREVTARNPLLEKPMHERTTYEQAFIQVTNLWRENETVRRLAFSRRLAQIAAALMGCSGVRLYHDQALYKEPGGGITPWHADQYYWPLDTPRTTTVWIPLQATPAEMGPLAFAEGSHRHKIGRDLPISDASEAVLQEALAACRFPVYDAPFDLGEVSFHAGWTFHRAGANTSRKVRAVMTMIYMDADARLAPFVRAEHVADRDAFLPGRAPGDAADTALNPVLFTGAA
jgi:ectoine hydroxylase-related dioxygenase (phytanoyl-CoA dioxygenase family)